MMMMMLIFTLLPAAFLLPPGAEAGEIIGGREAVPHSRPYMASLQIRSGDKGNHCGGFLLSQNIVLTAAHCNGDEITVYLGAHNIRKQEPSQQVIPVRRRVPHPRYDFETNNNDIMLLQLGHKAVLNKYVRPIHLPLVQQQVPPGTVCSVAGWGLTNATSGQVSATLQEVDVVVMPDATCKYRHYNPSIMFCVGDPKEGKSSFEGDSGGPLVCRGTAQGIVSFGSVDGTPPAVYTKVASFLPWIQANMRRLQP